MKLHGLILLNTTFLWCGSFDSGHASKYLSLHTAKQLVEYKIFVYPLVLWLSLS